MLIPIDSDYDASSTDSVVRKQAFQERHPEVQFTSLPRTSGIRAAYTDKNGESRTVQAFLLDRLIDELERILE